MDNAIKKCQFHDNPTIIAMYYDAVLTGEMDQVFSEHLINCKNCLEKLFYLERDLFLMRNISYNTPSKESV